jgi:hypothetical protein
MLYPELKEDGKTIPCFCCKRSCGQWKMKYVDDEFFPGFICNCLRADKNFLLWQSLKFWFLCSFKKVPATILQAKTQEDESPGYRSSIRCFDQRNAGTKTAAVITLSTHQLTIL